MDLADLILFEDAEAIIIDKPAGLPVDPPRDGGPSIATRTRELRLGFERVPVPVHRLDRDTSGCLLLARHPRALKRFQAAFAERLVTKTYLAIVAGRPPGDEGLINQPLAKRSSREAGWRMVPDPAGQSAETAWEWLASEGGTSLLCLTPTTGRTHQLRVHCASVLGCPIIGDPVYGRADARGMLLHASTLSVPRAGKDAVAAVAPFPARFAAFGYNGPHA
jgi:tRNA pseudouridine32 synthase / 23S rRNA pseudouridine746 synthase